MAIFIDKLRFIVKTQDVKDAGSDDRVEFWYFVNAHPLSTHHVDDQDTWQKVHLNHPWDDRERGRTELYEINTSSGYGTIVGGTKIPAGIIYNDFRHLSDGLFGIKIFGDDQWKIEQYYLFGKITEMIGPYYENNFKDHGWVHLAYNDGDIFMSTDRQEGTFWHSLVPFYSLPCRSSYDIPTRERVVAAIPG